MKITYSPENEPVQSWDYRPAKIKQSEAEMMERRSAMDWDALQKGIIAGNAKARKVLLWHCLRTEHPLFRWEDVPDFAMGEVKAEFDATELADLRTAVAAASLPDEDKAEALRMLDGQITELAAEDSPKALAL